MCSHQCTIIRGRSGKLRGRYFDRSEFQRLQTHKVDEAEVERNVDLLERAVDTISGSTRMIADVSDLARFGECTK